MCDPNEKPDTDPSPQPTEDSLMDFERSLDNALQDSIKTAMTDTENE